MKMTTKFDMAEYLDDDEMATEYLKTVLENDTPNDIISALNHVAKARRKTKITEESGLK